MSDVKPLHLADDPAPRPVSGQKHKFPVRLAGGFIILAILGAGSGYGLFRFKNGPQVKRLKTEVNGEAASGETYGVDDTRAFTDSAEGELTSGGIDGEGSHHLIREGGESQFVYLTSSVIDLDQFIGRRVKIWGQTFEAQKAGWLMDVGRLEVLK